MTDDLRGPDARDDDAAPDELAEAEEYARTLAQLSARWDDGQVPAAMLSRVLAEYDRRGAELERYVTQVIHVGAHVPGPEPVDMGAEWHTWVADYIERLRGIEQRAQEGDVHADEHTDALLRWILHGADLYEPPEEVETRTSLVAEVERLRARVAELEAGEVRTEWGIRWPEPDGAVRYVGSSELVHGPDTERFREAGGQIVQREAREYFGPWIEVSS